MMTIHKFAVKPDAFTVSLPRTARVLSVQTQLNQAGREQACMWVYLDDLDGLKEERKFMTIGTGHNGDAVRNMRFVGTFQLEGGALIFHLFEGGAIPSM